MSFVSYGSNKAAAASVTVTAPAGIRDGDILIAHVASYRSTSAVPSAITLAGFTWTTRTTSTYYVSAVGWKRAAAESGNYTFTSANATQMAASIAVFRGRLAVGTPCAIVNTAYITSNTNCRAATSTAVEGDDYARGYFYYSATTQTLTLPANHTDAGYQQVTSIMAERLCCITNVAAGATGTIDSVMGTAGVIKHAYTVQLYADRPGHRLQRAGSQVW